CRWPGSWFGLRDGPCSIPETSACTTGRGRWRRSPGWQQCRCSPPASGPQPRGSAGTSCVIAWTAPRRGRVGVRLFFRARPPAALLAAHVPRVITRSSQGANRLYSLKGGGLPYDFEPFGFLGARGFLAGVSAGGGSGTGAGGAAPSNSHPFLM